jgi:hypothetical protein
MGNYIYYGYTSVRRTVTLEPAKKVDTVVEVSRPCCEIETIEKVIANTAHIVKVEQNLEEKVQIKEKEEVKQEVKAVEEVKEEVKQEVKAIDEVKEEVEIKAVEVKEVEVKAVEIKEVDEVKVKTKEVNEKMVIEWKSAKKEMSPLLPPIKEEPMDVHPFLLEYGTAPVKSNTVLIQNQTYQIKKKNKKKD